MGNKRKLVKASYTVEAAFIVPLLLGIAFLIMYVTFLLHDRVILQGNFSYVLCEIAEGNMETEERGKMLEILKKKLWVTEIYDVQIKNNFGRISGKVHGEANWEIPVLSVFMNEVQKTEISGEYYAIQPEQVKFP